MQKSAISDRFDYIPTSREQAWGLYVLGTGRRVEPPHTRYQRPERGNSYPWNDGRVLMDYGMVYITGGEGVFQTRESRWRKVTAGDVLFLFPGVWHNYHPGEETGWTERWVLFNGTQAGRWLENGLISGDSPIRHVGVRNDLTERFERLMELARRNPPFANQIQAGVTAEILGMILQYHQTQPASLGPRTDVLEKALDFLRKNWRSPIDFAALAARSGVSSRHFRRLFQQATGLSPQQYVLNLRLNEAKRLLGSMPIYEVAERVGFENALYFSRLFKEKIGVSPSRWH